MTIANTQFVNDTLCQNIVDLGVEEMTANSEVLNVSPNPSTGVFQFNNLDAENTVYVYDYLGQLIYEDDNASQVDLTDHINGMYFIFVKTSNGKTYHAKAVLAK